MVHVFEVDPTLKNKKITVSGLKQYLNTYYLTASGSTVYGSFVVQNNLTTSGLTVSNLSVLSGVIVQNNLTTSGIISGATITGNTGQFTNITFVSGVGTAQISGALITGNTGLFTTVTGASGIFTSYLFGATITGNQVSAPTGTFGILITSGHTVQNDLTISGNLRVLGSGSFASGVTITGTLSGTTFTGTTANFTSGNYVACPLYPSDAADE